MDEFINMLLTFPGCAYTHFFPPVIFTYVRRGCKKREGGNNKMEKLMLIEMIFSGMWPSALPETAKKPFINICAEVHISFCFFSYYQHLSILLNDWVVIWLQVVWHSDK